MDMKMEKINLMKNTNVRLTIVFVFLTLTGLLLNDPFGWFVSNYNDAPLFIDGKIKNSIEKIELSRDGQQLLTFTNGNEGWSVGAPGSQNYKCDTDKLENGLNLLFNARKYYEISSNPVQHERYGVGKNGLKIRFSIRPDRSFTLYIGEAGSGYGTTMVREEGNDTVYSVKGSLKQFWDQPVDQFRYRGLFNFTADNIKSVSVNIRGKTGFELFNDQANGWKLLANGKQNQANPENVHQFTGEIASLEGVDFYYGNRMGVPYGSLTIMTFSSVKVDLEIRKLNEEDYIVRSSQNDQWQKIPAYRVKSLLPELSSLISTEIK